MIKLQPAPIKYVLPLVLLYSVISVVGAFHHEIFLEEAQQLTIARDSSSVIDVFRNMLYEGHVTLWNTLLFFITHYISSQPIYMQLFHLLITCCTVFIFLRYAPFNLTIKTLIIFGCYFFYVYSIISRNYALGIFLLFVCCILMANPAKNMVRIGVMVVLMCFTHLFYVFAATGIFFYLLSYTVGKKELYKPFIIFSVLFLFGSIYAGYQTMRIPDDSILKIAHGVSLFNTNNISFGIICFARGYITIPPLQLSFWDKQYIQCWPDAVTISIGILIFAATVLAIYKSKRALLFYLPAVLLLIIFFIMSHVAGNRYFGMFLVFFIAALWLAYYDGVTIFSEKNVGFLKKWIPQLFVYIILINQLFTGLYMYNKDFRSPFSQAKNTVNYLRLNHLENQPLAVDGYNAGPSLSAYLGKKVYYLDFDQFGSFCIWKRVYLPFPRRLLMDEISSSRYINRFKTFMLITNRDNSINDNQIYHFERLTAFEGAISDGENYFVYRVNRKYR